MKAIVLLALICGSYAIVLRSASTGREIYNDALLQLNDEEIDHSTEYYAAGDQGMTPNGVEYIRNMPAQFDEESSNKFMNKVIDEYALEQKTKEGKPSGIFKMDKNTTT